MAKNKKRDFLSNDFRERMIRIEQRVSGKFGKSLAYDKTEYYKSMGNEQKKEFRNYLKNKKTKSLSKKFK